MKKPEVVCIAFTTHMNTEEGDGQYVRYAYSLNGGSGWSAPMTLFAPPCEQSEKKEKVAARAAGWAEIDNDLYAIIHILRTDGMLAIKINPDNSFGTPFWIYPAKNQPAPLDGRPQYTYDPLLSPRIMDYLMETSNFPVRGKPHEYFEYTDRYIEPSGIVLPSGYEMLLWRWFRPLAEDKTINPAQKRKYLQYRQGNKGKFSDMAETEIIDSRSVTKWKVLSDGKVGIIGNDTDPRRTALFYSEADPYKLEFKPVYNLVSQVDYQVKFPGGGKNGGASYVDFIEYNNMIICVYSERKEDIKVTRFLRPKK